MNHLIFNLCPYIIRYEHKLQYVLKNLQAFVGSTSKGFFDDKINNTLEIKFPQAVTTLEIKFPQAG